MAPQDELLRRICGGKNETYREAQRIFPVAQAKTGPGSGYALGQGATGLPAVCAYIASQNLVNNNVSEKTAQAASCLKPKVFANTLKLVRAALSASSSEDGASSDRGTLTYLQLIRHYKIPLVEKVTQWLEAVEDSLLDGDKRWEVNTMNRSVKCTVFYWTCSILDIERVEPKALIAREQVPAKAFNSICKALDEICDPLAARIRGEVTQLRAESKRKRSATKPSPSKSPPKSPSKPALRTRSMTASSPSKDAAEKRKVIFAPRMRADSENDDKGDDVSMPETPTKKRKIDHPPIKLSPLKARSSTSIASSSRDTLDIMDADRTLSQAGSPAQVRTRASVPGTPSTPRRSQRLAYPPPEDAVMDVDVPSSEEDDEPPRPRRFRPVFLDRQQWARRDPRVEEVERQLIRMMKFRGWDEGLDD